MSEYLLDESIKGDILIVDDLIDNLDVLENILSKEGYKVRIATNGKKALQVVETKLPEIILLDIMMPEMDGFETCKELKANPKTAKIPIIFISAKGEVEDKVQAFEVGGVDYITKPFHEKEVLARVKTHLTLYRMQNNLEDEINTRSEEILFQQKFLDTILSAQPNIITVHDEHKLIFANSAFYEFLNRDSSLNEFVKKPKCFCELFQKSEEKGYLYEGLNGKSCMENINNSTKPLKVLIKRKDREYRFMLSAKKMYFNGKVRNICTFTDITELENYRNRLEKQVKKEIDKRRKQEEKMFQQAKLAQMGEMITMISHHWRQPLNVIGLIIQNLQDDYEYKVLDEEVIEDAVEQTMAILDKMSETLETLSSFMVEQKNMRCFDVIEATQKISNLIYPELEASFIDFKQEYPKDKIQIYGIPSFYGQILNQLIKNAEEAVISNSQSDRKISIKVSVDNKNIKVSIYDNGGEIKDEIKPRLFEPFFTTKTTATKTGLGLYYVKMLVEEQFNGEIDFKNIDNGVEFTITIPIAKDEL